MTYSVRSATVRFGHVLALDDVTVDDFDATGGDGAHRQLFVAGDA